MVDAGFFIGWGSSQPWFGVNRRGFLGKMVVLIIKRE